MAKRGKKGKSYSAKKLAVCAMLAALGVVLLSLGALISVMDISMAVIASLLCIVAVIEYGGSAPWMVYLVTSLISLFFFPTTPALFYAVFFGYYPILKEKFEKKPMVISWLFKEITFNAALALAGVATVYGFLGIDNELVNPIYIGVVVLLAQIVFVLYDIALTRLISIYLISLRKRFKF